MFFDAGRSITWAMGKLEQVGPDEISSFLGGAQKIALAYRIDAISKGPKNSTSRAQPPPTCRRNVSACIKNIMRGAI